MLTKNQAMRCATLLFAFLKMQIASKNTIEISISNWNRWHFMIYLSKLTHYFNSIRLHLITNNLLFNFFISQQRTRIDIWILTIHLRNTLLKKSVKLHSFNFYFPMHFEQHHIILLIFLQHVFWVFHEKSSRGMLMHAIFLIAFWSEYFLIIAYQCSLIGYKVYWCWHR